MSIFHWIVRGFNVTIVKCNLVERRAASLVGVMWKFKKGERLVPVCVSVLRMRLKEEQRHRACVVASLQPCADATECVRRWRDVIFQKENFKKSSGVSLTVPLAEDQAHYLCNCYSSSVIKCSKKKRKRKEGGVGEENSLVCFQLPV